MLVGAMALAMVVASSAFAQEFDPNPLNRYPQYNGSGAPAAHGTFQTGTVRLDAGRNASRVPEHRDGVGNRAARDLRHHSTPKTSSGGY